jgi:hypothetical protein
VNVRDLRSETALPFLEQLSKARAEVRRKKAVEGEIRCGKAMVSLSNVAGANGELVFVRSERTRIA